MNNYKANTTVTVIMITYNHEPFISEAIEGVLKQQTDFKIKLFITDDCSSDKTSAICKSYAEKHPKLIDYELLNNNIGSHGNTLYCLQKCLDSGADYIAICEGDDYWTDPLKLQKQVDFLEKNKDYNICFHNASVIKDNRIIKQIYSPNRKQTITLTDLFKGDFTKTCCVIFRNNIDISDVSVEMIQDTTLFMKCLEDNKKAYFINEDMAVYRIHAGGVFSLMKTKDKLLQAFKIRSYIYNKYKQHPDSYLIAKTLKEISTELSLIYLKTFEIKSFFIWWLNSRKYKAKIPLRKYYHLAKKHLITR